jgi:hypothetical protein
MFQQGHCPRPRPDGVFEVLSTFADKSAGRLAGAFLVRQARKLDQAKAIRGREP